MGIDAEVPCTICKGGRSEHFNENGKQITVHTYTTVEGDLVSADERAKQSQQQPPMRIPMSALGGGDSGNTARLVELLMERGMLDTADGLYIAGMGPKPLMSPEKMYQQPFRDPFPRAGH